jgi:hypothetical protein
MPQPKRSTSSSSSRSGSTAAKKKPAAKTKPAARTKPATRKEPATAASAAETNLSQALSALRDAIAKLDAEGLVNEVVSRGRQQTEGVLGEIEQLLERGRKQLEEARKRADTAAGRVRRSSPGDRVVRAADRARRTVGVGPSFPILGYDDLTAAQVIDRVGELSPPQLRKVRDYERRHANRKSVLAAIERALA